MKSIVDLVELFTRREHYLWVWEIGKLEVLEGLESIPRNTRWRLDSLAQWGRNLIGELEKEPGVEPEMEPEVEPEVELEVVPVDVEMPLQ